MYCNYLLLETCFSRIAVSFDKPEVMNINIVQFIKLSVSFKENYDYPNP